MEIFFVVVYEIYLYLILKVIIVFFLLVCLLFMKKVYSIVGGGCLINICSGIDLIYCYFICIFFFILYVFLM